MSVHKAAKYIIFLCIFLGIFSFKAEAQPRDTISLAGTWDYRLLEAPTTIPGEGSIMLPSTLDVSGKSLQIPPGNSTEQLRQEFSFTGEAVYSRSVNIPSSWNGKAISLLVERTKPSTLIIDGTTVGSNSRISSPQIYDVSDFLTPGFHTISLAVNNADSIPPMVAKYSNAVSESSQTNWNGILGKMLLEAKDPFNIESVKIGNLHNDNTVSMNVSFSQPAPADMILAVSKGDKSIKNLKIPEGSLKVVAEIPVNDSDKWDPRNPLLHDFCFALVDKTDKIIDLYELTTGFRSIDVADKYFRINDTPVFLRGMVNPAVFPITGYAPLDSDYWVSYFEKLKEYGLNHVRFHSWTPPEAAFDAADKTGFVILAELPIWGNLDRDMTFHNAFLREELRGIMQSYSSHPSFLLFSPGNELWGDISLMGEYMAEAKRLNPGILSTYGTNLYLGINGEIGGEDFIISAKTSEDPLNAVRGSLSFADSSTGGYFNSSFPESFSTFENATNHLSAPVISHEVGQYQSYPDFSQIENYTGLLKPDNLIEFQRRADEAGTLGKNKLFSLASGIWAAKLMKAEMEMAVRTPGIAGFQLYGLQDFPGQGGAFVGILDPLLNPKGLVSPEEWKQSGDDVMLIARFPKFCFTSGETVEIPVSLVNFTDRPDSVSKVLWTVGFKKGEFTTMKSSGISKLGTIKFTLPKVTNPRQLQLSIFTPGSDVKNEYDFWVFPAITPKNKNVTISHDLSQTLELLEKGKKVIYYPDSATIGATSVGSLFTPDFWNYRMYKKICEEMGLPESPGTLGLFINESHPALKKFPTSFHTDWQWYPVITNSRPLIIDRLPKDYSPVVEVIDNIDRNYRLGLILEFKVGKGELIVISSDLEEAAKYPEGRWLIHSLADYLASKDFKPAVTLSPQQLVNLLTKPSDNRRIKELLENS